MTTTLTFSSSEYDDAKRAMRARDYAGFIGHMDDYLHSRWKHDVFTTEEAQELINTIWTAWCNNRMSWRVEEL